MPMPPDAKPLSWESLRRQIRLGESPYLGVPLPGRRPLAFKRDLLAATCADLRWAFAWVAGGATPFLEVVSACGTRRYRYWDQYGVPRSSFLAIPRAQRRWSEAKRGALARQNGWVRRERWHDVADDVAEGGARVSWYKGGLIVRDNLVVHRASGRNVLVASSQSEAFVLAERALRLWSGWNEPDPAKLLESMGDERRRAMAIHNLRRAA